LPRAACVFCPIWGYAAPILSRFCEHPHKRAPPPDARKPAKIGC
jgi:hypothetical protein